MDKKVSIVLPCYNVSKFLEDCFKSLDNLIYENVEIIFVNDGSKDNTLELLNEYCNQNKKARVITKENGGVASARNLGIEHATGDYIYFYDPDDIVPPNIINVLLSSMISTNSQLCIMHYDKIKENYKYENIKFRKNNKIKSKIYDKKSTILNFISQKLTDYFVWNKLYDLHIIKDNNVRFLQGCRYGEEVYFNYKYMTFISQSVYLKNRVYYYRVRANSLASSTFKEYKFDEFICINKIIEETKDDKDINDCILAFKGLICFVMLYLILNSDYDNKNVINTLLVMLKQHIPFVKRCKNIHLHRRVLLGITPCLFSLLLKKRIKNGKDLLVPEKLK